MEIFIEFKILKFHIYPIFGKHQYGLRMSILARTYLSFSPKSIYSSKGWSENHSHKKAFFKAFLCGKLRQCIRHNTLFSRSQSLSL